MRTNSGLFFGGLIQLAFIVTLAVLLLYAAYFRAGTDISLQQIGQWGINSFTGVSGFFVLIVLWSIRGSERFSNRLRQHGIMLISLLCLSALLLQHLLQGSTAVTLFDVATVLLIAFLFAVELNVFQQGMVSRFQQAKASASYKTMRPAIFLFLFGIDLSMSFIPLHMEQLPQFLQGVSADLLIGLPISVEFLFVGIAILICGVWLDRSGWRQPFYTGLIVTGVGALYSWLATDAINFILSRGVLGFGYGLTLLASQGFVIRQTDNTNKARGLAHLFAGLYSGSICGAATGAVMAEHFGYSMVFLCGGVIIFTVVFYGILVLREESASEKVIAESTPAVSSETQPTTVEVPKAGVLAFLLDRRVLAATLFSSMPASIAVVGFLNYFSPIYLNRSGSSESEIGQVLMLFGVILALFGPAIGRFADHCTCKRIPIMMGCVLGSAAFMVFYLFSGVMAVTVAILMLGLSNCLVLSAQSAFVLKQDVTISFGEGKAMGIFRSSSRIGQMLGPMIFAGLILSVDVEHSVMLFGVGYLITAVLFWWLSDTKKGVSQPSMSKEGA